MGVLIQSFHFGGVTPICNDCGVSLCWDLDPETYEEERPYWEAWRCAECFPPVQGSRRRWRHAHGLPVSPQTPPAAVPLTQERR